MRLCPIWWVRRGGGMSVHRSAREKFAGILSVVAVVAAGLGVGATPADAAPYVAQAAIDPLTGLGAQHQSIVEPVSAAWGSTIVSTYQVGRYAANGSGAAATGWATSTDGGVTWTSGLVPNVTTATNPPGIYGRTVNMTVAYDRAHGQFILTTLGMELVGASYQEAEVFVTRSSDGLNWTTPQSVVIGNRPDKDWTVCDNTPTSPFFGRCYIVYSSDNQSFRFLTVRSDDGGLTWSAPVATPSNSVGYNVNPVVRPDGTLVVVATNVGDTQIVAFRSVNGGVTFTNSATAATVSRHDVVGGIRDRPKPSATVDAAGRVYAAWFDCRFRSGCTNNDIVWVKSDDGLVWSSVQRVDVDPVGSTVEHFVAGLGVRPGTSGATAQLDLIFYQMPVAACTATTCDITAVTTSSTDGGATWAPTTALHSTPMKPTWLPNSSLGRMLTDYQNIVYRNGIPLATLPIASLPVGSTSEDFRQSLYFARLSLNNASPSGAIVDDCIGLVCNFDASASFDPDGSIVAYAWDFGDGTTATGPTTSHTFASAGYVATLTVTDNLGATGTRFVTDVNQLPSAAFTSSCSATTCTVNASTSADPDGSIVSYAWQFSDGTTDTGVAPQHAFSVPGTWQATLTVTDNDGAVGSVSHDVVTQIPTDPGPLASDTFGRSTASGWGSADLGGVWSTTGTASNATVNGSEGQHRLVTTGASLGTSLSAVASVDTEFRTVISSDRAPTGAGHWTSFIVRRVNSTNEYRVRVKFGTTGMALAAIKLPNSTTSAFIGSEVVTALAATSNQKYQLRAQVLGVNPTTIRAKLWLDGQSEPVSWSLNQTDSTATIQSAGSVSLSSYVSGSAVPLVFSFDDLVVQGVNRYPIASFGRSCVLLDCAFDASGTTDSDGSVANYEWSFGDGATAVGVTPAHSYAAVGSYTVTMTATDNQGARAGTAQTFIVDLVTNPPPPVIADDFSRTATSSWGSAVPGGAWSISGITSNFAVNGSAATHKLTAVNTSGTARLLSTPLADADVQVRVAADQTPVGSGYWLNVVGRSVSSANEYRARVRFSSTGLFVGAYRVVNGGSSSVMGTEVSTGLAVTPGQFYRVRMNVSGTNPTTIKIKVWLDGATEPASWLVTQTDSSASIQAQGTVGLTTWIQGTTPLPLIFTFDDLVVRPAN